jgi:molybdate transport system ATP-binding protein
MAAHRSRGVTGLEARVVVRRPTFTLDARIDVAPGEVVAVLGPNGAGKSTLLRVVCGLEPLSDGHIRLAGRMVDDAAQTFVAPSKRRVGIVFQDYRLFPHLSVLDNVAFGPRSTGASTRASREAAAAWVDRLGLTAYAQRRPAALSGGQAQRVALARALACDPDVLLLDEPLSALDAGTRLDVRADLREHLHGFAGPTLLVTHDPVDALVLADRLVVLEDGAITQQGQALEVARRPASTYVARLLGLNLLRGSAREGDVSLDGGGTLHVTDHDASGRVLVAVRPSAIALHAQAPEGSARNVWSGTVDGIESIGDRVRVTVLGPPTVMVDVTPAAVSELGLRRTDPVWLSAKATELEVYPG